MIRYYVSAHVIAPFRQAAQLMSIGIKSSGGPTFYAEHSGFDERLASPYEKSLIKTLRFYKNEASNCTSTPEFQDTNYATESVTVFGTMSVIEASLKCFFGSHEGRIELLSYRSHESFASVYGIFGGSAYCPYVFLCTDISPLIENILPGNRTFKVSSCRSYLREHEGIDTALTSAKDFEQVHRLYLSSK